MLQHSCTSTHVKTEPQNWKPIFQGYSLYMLGSIYKVSGLDHRIYEFPLKLSPLYVSINAGTKLHEKVVALNSVTFWFWSWFCNQQDSFTNMIADRSAWGLICAILDLNRSKVLASAISWARSFHALIHLGKNDCPYPRCNLVCAETSSYVSSVYARHLRNISILVY